MKEEREKTYSKEEINAAIFNYSQLIRQNLMEGSISGFERFEISEKAEVQGKRIAHLEVKLIFDIKDIIKLKNLGFLS